MTVKVGDVVVSLVNQCDIKKGLQYKVIEVLEQNSVEVIDDAGDEWVINARDYQLMTSSNDNTQYIKILEAIAGEDAVKMARNISEALKDE